MAEEEGEFEEDDIVPSTPLHDLTKFAVIQSDSVFEPDYVVGTFSLPERTEGDPVFVPIIIVSAIQQQFLVAVPFEVWHRTRSNRVLPVDSLIKPVAVVVDAVLDLDRENFVEGPKQKIWLGLLRSHFEACVSFDPPPEIVHAPFRTQDGTEGFVPCAESLKAVAEEKFTFFSASEEVPIPPADTAAHRIARLEESMVQIRSSLSQLVNAKQDSAAPRREKGPRAKFANPLVQGYIPPLSDGGFAGLDPQVVQSALTARIDPGHLSTFSKMVQSQKPKMADAPGAAATARAKHNILGESEDEDEQESAEENAAADPSDPVQAALVKLTKIVDRLAANPKKQRSWEELLDDSSAALDASSSSLSSGQKRHFNLLRHLKRAMRDAPEEIYKVIESRMELDFGSAEVAPGAPGRTGTFRGWCEHRSRIPNIPGSVRTCWAVAGALDSLRAGRISEGKAKLAIFLSQMDQVAVDRGQWLLAAEASMEEVPPPFSSFARHSPPDMLEPQHTRLWPTAWAEAYMFKVRELDDFVEKRSKLGRRVNPIRVEEVEQVKGGGKKGKKGKGEKGDKDGKNKLESPASSSQNQA